MAINSEWNKGVDELCEEIAILKQQLAAAEERLARIDAVSKADAEDLSKMRDGTKLTRHGLVEIIAYQQDQLAAAREREAKLQEAVQCGATAIAQEISLVNRVCRDALQQTKSEACGRCWHYLPDGKTCPRHGDVSDEVERFVKTGVRHAGKRHAEAKGNETAG